jgi:formylglycine-generating enzyme required for sulfatase activity
VAVDDAILEDRLKWNNATVAEQDTVIARTGKKLGRPYWFVETKKYSCGGETHRIATFVHTKTGLLLNLIPGGTFQMGDDNSDYEDERPAHKATIKPMLIGRFPVTQDEWQKIGGKNPSYYKGSDNPVETVSWDDIQSWLKKAGDGLRLPSESEWEYACRGTGHPAGTTTQYFWGDEMDNSYCWYDVNCYNAGHEQTREVSLHFDQQKWNAFGLVDMSGNVWEWCQDQWINDYEFGPRDSQPRTSNSSFRVRRGGSWYDHAVYCRSAYRYSLAPSNRGSSIGFRVSRTCS